MYYYLSEPLVLEVVMKKSLMVLPLAVFTLAISACSTKQSYDFVSQVKSSPDEMITVPDYRKIALIEYNSKKQAAAMTRIWVNPPTKQIKRSELDSYMSQFEFR